MSLAIDHINKAFSPELITARDVSLNLGEGQIGALIGPSGCGKTTLLRMIAGFETPDSGRITIMGKTVCGHGIHIPPEQRQTGMVFQDYALFPHLTISANINFGPKNSGKALTRPELADLFELTGLTGLEAAYPHELSGGQQQRVALARALAVRPHLLLMDEPFSNLDITLRERLSEEVGQILKTHGTTGLLVTHNQHEAFAMADLIGVMKAGQLLQWDTARNLYFSPACPEVAQFVGEGTLLQAERRPDGSIETELGIVSTLSTGNGESVTVFIRPEGIVIDNESPCRATLVRSHFRGPGSVHTFALPSGRQVFCLDHCPVKLPPGSTHGLSLCSRHINVFPAA